MFIYYLRVDFMEYGYWLEVITEGEVLADAETFKLLKEANELNAIFTASAKTAKMNRWLKQQGDKEIDS